MTPLADLEAFVRDHRPHGGLTGDATEPTSRWVTPDQADADLLRLTLLN
jgi:hypothetical protein